MGTPEFAVVSLKRLLEAKINIVAVVTASDKPSGRGLKIQMSPVKKVALDANIPILQPEKLTDPDFLKRLSDLKPDLIVVVAFRILPESIFTLPIKGTINLHGSLLPKYRGAAPINWAIINGETETGVTTFFIKKEVDTGNIIDRQKVSITPNMTAGELHDIMADVGSDLLLETVRKVEQGKVITSKQDDILSTNAPKIHREDCVINFHQSAQSVHNFIRGLSPYPAAHTYLKGRRIRLFKSELHDLEALNAGPGSIIEISEGKKLIIQCKPGKVSIKEIQVEGKKRMMVESYLRGAELGINSVFEISALSKGD
jgi:methionyl-tRNA formyltransferase